VLRSVVGCVANLTEAVSAPRPRRGGSRIWIALLIGALVAGFGVGLASAAAAATTVEFCAYDASAQLLPTHADSTLVSPPADVSYTARRRTAGGAATSGVEFVARFAAEDTGPGRALARSDYPPNRGFEARSLRSTSINSPYNVYEVVNPLTVQGGITAPAFGYGGGGIQYEFGSSFQDLIERGMIKRVGP
jgi:hypothetical protein